MGKDIGPDPQRCLGHRDQDWKWAGITWRGFKKPEVHYMSHIALIRSKAQGFISSVQMDLNSWITWNMFLEISQSLHPVARVFMTCIELCLKQNRSQLANFYMLRFKLQLDYNSFSWIACSTLVLKKMAFKWGNKLWQRRKTWNKRIAWKLYGNSVIIWLF